MLVLIKKPDLFCMLILINEMSFYAASVSIFPLCQCDCGYFCFVTLLMDYPFGSFHLCKEKYQT